jgi:predicted nucleotidyltransferase
MEKQAVPVSSKEKVVEALRVALTKKNAIIFAYLHGSYLDGVLYNDIDVAIYLDQSKIDREKQDDYCDRLNDCLSELLRFVVDVRIMNHAPAGFQHSVYKHGQLLFCRDDRLRTDLVEKTSMDVMLFYELSLENLRDMVYHG